MTGPQRPLPAPGEPSQYEVAPTPTSLEASALPLAVLFFVTSMPLFVWAIVWARASGNEAASGVIAVAGVALTGLPGLVLGRIAKRSKHGKTRRNGTLAEALGLVVLVGPPVMLAVLLWMLDGALHLPRLNIIL